MVKKFFSRLIKSKSKEDRDCELYYSSVYSSTDILFNEFYSSTEELNYLERDWMAKDCLASSAMSAKNGPKNKTCKCNNEENCKNMLEKRFQIKSILSQSNKCIVYSAKCKKTSRKLVIKKFVTSKLSRNETAMTKLAFQIIPDYTLPVLLSFSELKNVTRTRNQFGETGETGMENTRQLVVHNLIQPKYGESLFDFMANRKQTLSIHECKFIYKQVICALSKLQANGIYHLDLKEENILIDPYTFNIKLIDFGITKTCPIEPGVIAGSIDFIAPEIILGFSNYDSLPKHDVWSIGVAIYSSLTGQLPYNDIQKVIEGQEMIKLDLLDDVIKEQMSASNGLFAFGKVAANEERKIRDQLHEIFKKCFVLNYRQRIGMSGLLECGFFM